MSDKVLYVGFNTDRTCLTIGTEMGFFAYDMFPFKRKCSHYFGKGVKIVEILDRTNIVALVGGGAAPAWPVNTVVVWDCKRREEVSRVEWSTEIMSVKLLRNYLFLGVCGKVFVYDPQTLTFIKSINDAFPHHICVALPTQAAAEKEGGGEEEEEKEGGGGGRRRMAGDGEGEGDGTLVTEGKDGRIKVARFQGRGETAFETRDYKAHDGPVVCVAASADGRYCATASDKGTLIRVFSRDTGEKVRELRRGSSQAAITSITFSQDNAYLATTSDHGTAHVFATGLAAAGGGENGGSASSSNARNVRSMFSFTGLGITQSEWSPCSFAVGHNSSLCFTTDGNGVTRLIVVKEGGEYSSYLICTNGSKVTASEEGSPVSLLTFSV